MRASRPLHLLLPVLTLAACGNIVDPSPGSNGSNGSTAKHAEISGALTAAAAIPSTAHVALVWRTPTGVAIGGDALITNGAFTMDLTAPPDADLAAQSGDFWSTLQEVTATGGSGGSSSGSTSTVGSGSSSSGSSSAGVVTGSSTGGSSSGGSPIGSAADAGVGPQVRRFDTPTGGTVGNGLEAALGGFVVYVDANGNGALDLTGTTASSPDQLIGGASDLVLVYLADGSALDYERLADTASVVPAAGFNLALTEGHWVGLNLVDLTLASAPSLPLPVCNNLLGLGSYDGSGSSGGSSSGAISGGEVPTPAPADDAGAFDPYPLPGAPGLTCSADGLSYTYEDPSSCTAPVIPMSGLCSAYTIEGFSCSGSSGGEDSIPSNSTIPYGWPCPVPVQGVAEDGGSAPPPIEVFDAGAP